MALTVWARDTARARRGQLVTVSGSAVLRENAVSTWRFEVDDSNAASQMFDEGWGVVVYEDNELLFSGPATEIGRRRVGSSYTLTITGVSDLHTLADRVVMPNPDLEWFEQDVAYYSRTGAGQYVQDIIADMVNRNAGPSALAYRQTPGLLSMTGGAGNNTTSTVNARFSVLLEEVAVLARVGGYVVDVVQEGTSLQPVLRTTTDRSRYIRFMPNTGLGETEFVLKAPTATIAFVGGQGEGAARTIRGVSMNQNSWGGRRVELFQDRRDTDVIAELDKAGVETLTELGPAASSAFTVTETPDLIFGKHYKLGDKVTVAVSESGNIVDRVTEAELTWDGHGRKVDLVVGENRTGEMKTPAAVKEIRALQRRINRLEAR